MEMLFSGLLLLGNGVDYSLQFRQNELQVQHSNLGLRKYGNTLAVTFLSGNCAAIAFSSESSYYLIQFIDVLCSMPPIYVLAAAIPYTHYWTTPTT